MIKMSNVELSPTFTVDDIRALRENNHERRKDMTFDEYWADVEKAAEISRKIIKRIMRNKEQVHT